MATEAETLLDGTGWLPEPLRTPGNDQAKTRNAAQSGDTAASETLIEESVMGDDETTIVDNEASSSTDESDGEPRSVAAE